MANQIKNKYTAPKSTEFTPKDLVVDVKNGHLYYKSNIGVHKLVGDNINTSLIEGGSGLWVDNGTFIFYDGNVSASGNLNVEGNITASNINTLGYLLTNGNIVASGPSSIIQSIDTTQNYIVELVGGGGPKINFGDTDTSTNSFMTIGAYSSINQIDTKGRDFHLYGTNTTTGFYFDESAGRFGIGTTTLQEKLTVEGNISSSGIGVASKAAIGTDITSIGDRKIKVQASDADGHYYLAQFDNNLSTSANDGNGLRINLAADTVVDIGISAVRKFILFTKSGGGGSNFMGGVYGQGNSTNGVNYVATSDKRLKHSIVDTHYSIKDLLKIKVRDYKWNDSDVLCNGFIAQELNEVYPEAVSTTDNGIDPLKEGQIPWSLDYGKLTPLLVKSIQDQQKMIEKLQKEIKEIKNELSGI